MTNQLKSFVHRLNGESYLFGYEDFLDEGDLRHIWDFQLWMNKDTVEAGYGEATPEEIINATARETGLRPPSRGSRLGDFVMSEAMGIVTFEEDSINTTTKLLRLRSQHE